MKGKKFLIPLVLIGLGAAFWWWNNNRIKALRAELARIQSEPIPQRTDHNKWTQIFRVLLDLGEDVYAQFRPGGIFYNGKNTLGDLEIDEYLRNIA